MGILIDLILIICIVCCGIRNMIFSNKLKRAIKLRKFEEANIWLYKRYLFFGNLYITTKFLIYKIEIEFYRGNLRQYDFSEVFNFLLKKKRKLNYRTLTLFALTSINNGDVATAKILLDNDIENKDSEYCYEISLLKDYVDESYIEFIRKFDAERFQDSDVKAVFIRLLDMAQAADAPDGVPIKEGKSDSVDFISEEAWK